jgi:hypothetical protein
MTEPAPCSRCGSPLEGSDLRCAVCGLPTPVSREPEGSLESEVAQIFRCHGCGAAIAYDASIGAPSCGFCRAVMELETPTDPIEQAEAFLPFEVDADTAREALRRWLGSLGWFRPRDLRERAVLSKLEPLWWAGWAFDANVRVTWAADSDAGAGRSAWAPHAGARSLRLERVLVSASRGLTEEEVVGLAASYRLDVATPTPEGPPGSTVEQFAVQRSGARRTVVEALQRVAAAAVAGDVPGSKLRNLHVAVLPERLVTRRLAFPAWILAYRYGDKVYRAIVHGQDAACVHGDAPIAWQRIATIAIVVALVIAAIVAVLSLA